MKKILNEWRKFLLKENYAPKISFEETDKVVRLYHDKIDKNDHRICIYAVNPQGNYEKDFFIIGAARLEKTSKPCIKNTLQVSTIYTEPSVRGQGYGRLLYEMCFYIAKKQNYGLTSDHEKGTKPGAAGSWKKIEKLSDLEGGSMYTAKVTKKKSDTFDYTGKVTPKDKDDDCKPGNKKYMKKGSVLATDHSFIVNKDQGAKYKKMVKAHKAVSKMKSFLDGNELDDFEMDWLDDLSAGRFGEIYN